MIKYWLHPFNIFWLIFLAGLIALFFKKEKLYIILFAVAGIWFFVTSNFLLPKFLISQLENNYEPFDEKIIPNDSISYNIVVLGAGFIDNQRFPFNDQLVPSALSRLIEGIRIHQLLPNSKLIVSGPAEKDQISQAEVYKKAAMSLGVDSTAVSIMKSANNTFEEAKEYAKIFGKDSPVILVTSACHMSRAMLMFQHQKLQPIAAPTNFQFKSKSLFGSSWLPSGENMNNLHLAITEYIGTVYAKLFLF